MKSWVAAVLLVGPFLMLIGGCATVFKGYEDTVTLHHPPKGLRVFTKDGLELTTKTTSVHEKQQAKMTYPGSTPGSGEYLIGDTLVVDTIMKIGLRSNTEYLLVLKYQDKEKRVYVYPKIGTSWFILDLITGTFFVDAYTGNWNFFDDIDASFSE
jgi:hypothetical protein